MTYPLVATITMEEDGRTTHVVEVAVGPDGAMESVLVTRDAEYANITKRILERFADEVRRQSC